MLTIMPLDNTISPNFFLYNLVSRNSICQSILPSSAWHFNEWPLNVLKHSYCNVADEHSQQYDNVDVKCHTELQFPD